MIGCGSSHSGAFLRVAAVLMFLFASPMLFVPLAWARALRWKLPTETALTVYFGRCLGGVLCVLAAMGLAAAQTPAVQPFFFTLVLAATALNIAIHVWGACRRIQPLTETVEIVAWVALFLAALVFYPAA